MKFFEWRKPSSVPEKPTRETGLLGKWQRVMLAGSLVLLALLFSILLTRQSRFSVPAYQTGDIARADIIIPTDMLIEDEAATEARRAAAKAKTFPVYRFNPSLPDDQISGLKTAFGKSRTLLSTDSTDKKKASARTRKPSFRKLPASARADLLSAVQDIGIKPPAEDLLDYLVRENFNSSLEERIGLLLKDAYSSSFIPDDMSFAKGKEYVHRANIVTGKLEIVPVSVLSTLVQVRERVYRQIGQNSGLSADARRHVRRILESLMIPNLTFDESLTKIRQEEDARNVDHVLRKLKKGKVVLRQGDEVGADHLVQIEAIRQLADTGYSGRQTAGMAILTGILLALLLYFARFVTLSQWSYPGLVWFLLLTLTVNLLLLKISWFVCESVSRSFSALPFNDKNFFFYLLPFAYGSMLVSLLAGQRCAQIFVIFLSVLAAQAVGADLYGFFYILLTNLAGIVFLQKTTQRIGLIGTGCKLGLSAAVLFLILQTIGQASLDWTNGSFGGALAFLSGLLNAVFLVFTLPLCERLFMVATDIRLSELGNLNLKLIRELIVKAPGTYNHSVAVGTLCEGAAKAVGMNPLFLRIAALYHDIGKALQPEYFVENQKKGNPHDGIRSRESVQILKNHITYGISAARKEHLPHSIIDLIPQHHGTKLMRFFYEKAKEEATASRGEVQEELYRYGGPKPQTKAAAILMLADGIESAARTLSDHSEEKLRELIRKIVTDTTQEGQFLECDITLSEMNRIAESFLETLSSYYHDRITYPGYDFNQVLGDVANTSLPRP